MKEKKPITSNANNQVINLFNDVLVTKDKQNKCITSKSNEDARETRVTEDKGNKSITSKSNEDVRAIVDKLLVTDEQANEIVEVKVLNDKKVYENEKLGINDYQMNLGTKITKAENKSLKRIKGT